MIDGNPLSLAGRERSHAVMLAHDAAIFKQDLTCHTVRTRSREKVAVVAATQETDLLTAGDLRLHQSKLSRLRANLALVIGSQREPVAGKNRRINSREHVGLILRLIHTAHRQRHATAHLAAHVMAGRNQRKPQHISCLHQLFETEMTIAANARVGSLASLVRVHEVLDDHLVKTGTHVQAEMRLAHRVAAVTRSTNAIWRAARTIRIRPLRVDPQAKRAAGNVAISSRNGAMQAHRAIHAAAHRHQDGIIAQGGMHSGASCGNDLRAERVMQRILGNHHQRVRVVTFVDSDVGMADASRIENVLALNQLGEARRCIMCCTGAADLTRPPARPDDEIILDGQVELDQTSTSIARAAELVHPLKDGLVISVVCLWRAHVLSLYPNARLDNKASFFPSCPIACYYAKKSWKEHMMDNTPILFATYANAEPTPIIQASNAAALIKGLLSASEQELLDAGLEVKEGNPMLFASTPRALRKNRGRAYVKQVQAELANMTVERLRILQLAMRYEHSIHQRNALNAVYETAYAMSEAKTAHEKAIRLASEAGISVADIAKQAGMSIPTIRKMLGSGDDLTTLHRGFMATIDKPKGKVPLLMIHSAGGGIGQTSLASAMASLLVDTAQVKRVLILQVDRYSHPHTSEQDLSSLFPVTIPGESNVFALGEAAACVLMDKLIADPDMDHLSGFDVIIVDNDYPSIDPRDISVADRLFVLYRPEERGQPQRAQLIQSRNTDSTTSIELVARRRYGSHDTPADHEYPELRQLPGFYDRERQAPVRVIKELRSAVIDILTSKPIRS